jgi:hypothetical protein
LNILERFPRRSRDRVFYQPQYDIVLSIQRDPLCRFRIFPNRARKDIASRQAATTLMRVDRCEWPFGANQIDTRADILRHNGYAPRRKNQAHIAQYRQTSSWCHSKCEQVRMLKTT